MPAANIETQQAIIAAVRAIPCGEVASYGEVAQRAGLPGHARYVAYILKQHAEAMHLPWHRVVTAQGRIAFAPGDARFEQQRSLLREEGVRVNGAKVSTG